ncbi:MAG: ELM1/GtrOC1 family putative glycosyltransferase [Marinicella sp.]
MNKVNLCWVLSDGRKGHEVQSLALAKQMAQHVTLLPFHLKQPWLSFAPRIIPGMSHGVVWSHDNRPNLNNPPDVVITTGRKAAAVGKFISQKLKFQKSPVKHIQILDPKDQANNYDLVLTPEHDNKSGPNVISFTGSIHTFNESWFSTAKSTSKSGSCDLVLLIGNPPRNYFKTKFQQDIKRIRQLAAARPLTICGSPRLTEAAISLIKKHLSANDSFWFKSSDGPNPYQQILSQAQHIFITADSINMMNECAASQASITLLAKDFIHSRKHHRYIESFPSRWSDFENQASQPVKIPFALDQISADPKFQKLLNSPFSSNSG